MLHTSPPPRVATVLQEHYNGNLPRHFNREIKKEIYKQVLDMGLPSMGGFFLMSFYEIINIFWLAKLGAAPVAAVTAFTSFLYIIAVFNMIVGTGSVAVISRRFGEGDELRTVQSIKGTFLLKFGFGTVCGLLALPFLDSAMGFMGVAPDVIELAKDYGVLQLLTLGFCLTSYSIYTALRSMGKSRSAMMVQMGATVLNAILDPLLIFGMGPFPKLGIFGASLATSFCYIFVVISGMYMLSSKSSPIRIKWLGKPYPAKSEMWSILKIGLPSSLNSLSFSISSSIVVKFMAVYGTGMVAIYGLGNRVIHFAVMCVVGLSLGTGALIGQYLGSKEHYKAWIAAVLSTRLAFWLTAGFSILLVIAAPWVVPAFFDDPALYEMGVNILRIFAITLPLIAVHIGTECAFEGAGQNVPPMILSMIYTWILLVPMVYLAGPVLDLGPLSMVWAFALANGLGGIAALWLLRRGSWLKHQV